MRQRQSMNREGQREGDTESETGSRLWAISPEPDAGLELTDCEIMTWAKVRRLTDRATQVPLNNIFFVLNKMPFHQIQWKSMKSGFTCHWGKGLCNFTQKMLYGAHVNRNVWDDCTCFYLINGISLHFTSCLHISMQSGVPELTLVSPLWKVFSEVW